MHQHIATWNHARGVWETSQVNLLCGHSELYSETWPTSGMTRAGKAYVLPRQVHRINASEFSSLPTPTVSDLYTDRLASTQQSSGSLHSVTLAQVFHRRDLFLVLLRLFLAMVRR
ncbi:MAG TPA: hypothetical protein VK149_04175 [Sideroxyarcus sp.]|nr:hypothetical protein [Sideroxyarcus sp.]